MATPKGAWLLQAAALAVSAAFVPRCVVGLDAAEMWDSGDAHVALARSVAAEALAGVGASSFHTGSARFDGEWAFGTYSMTTLGLGQTVLARPPLRDALVPAMESSVLRLAAPETNAFGSAAWGDVGLAHLEDGHGHGYLGYANLALSMLRLVKPDAASAALNDELTEALARRLEAAPYALFETYPGEAYAPDMAMVAGSIALHDCAVGKPERGFMKGWLRAFSRYIEPDSGLLYQAADAVSGRPLDSPRGSGTAIAIYALSFADAKLSQRLYSGLRRHAVSLLGFGMMHEYPPGHAGRGDIDSGPVLFGVGVSPTGFGLAGARLHGDREQFIQLYRMAELFGVRLSDAHGSHFMAGGPLGNAILLAMSGASFDWTRHCKKVSS